MAAEVEKQGVARIRRSQQPRKCGEKVAGSGSRWGSIGYLGYFRVAVRAQKGRHVGHVVEAAVQLVGCSGVIASAEHGAFSGSVITLELLGETGVVSMDDGLFVGGQEAADGALVLLEFGELSLERHIVSILILFRSASSRKALEYAQARTNSEGCLLSQLSAKLLLKSMEKIKWVSLSLCFSFTFFFFFAFRQYGSQQCHGGCRD
jgi:hypothetical protein